MIGLQINITPTERYATVDGAPCQVWEGRTPLGSSCVVYVRWVDVPHGQDTREFDALGICPGWAPVIEPDDPETPGLVGAKPPIQPPGNPARGGKRDEEEEQKYLEGSG